MGRGVALAFAVSVALSAQHVAAWSLFGGGDSLEKGDPPSNDIVGAKIETCRGCRLNYLPRVRNFIENYLQQYEALDIRFIQGAPPELFMFNKYGQVVATHDLELHDEKSIANLLEKAGITKKTKKPIYVPRKFDHAPHCKAFRGREDCDLKEARSFRRDTDCLTELAASDAGHCECSGDLVLAVACGGRELKITCEDLCRDVLDGEEADLA
ncbi:Selenoprotein M [Diplonema papillatum]|nr:Selenoprotein M [Diplonema papillatum]